MAKKVRDVVVKVGEYQDRNTGETKARWKNVGALMKNDEDNSYFIMLERTFNPAGVPNPENRESVLLSCFVPQEQRQQGSTQSAPAQQQAVDPQAPTDPTPQGGGAMPDDEVPFGPEVR